MNLSRSSFENNAGFPADFAWPKISIVTPSFNQQPFLEQTIRSVLDQGYPNLEYIIVDGGSTDGSQAIIEKYEKYLALWLSEPDEGHYDALNKGFTHATGDILAYLNSDDMYFQSAFQIAATVFSSLPAVEWLSSQLPVNWDYFGIPSHVSFTAGFSKAAFLDGLYCPGLRDDRAPMIIQQESTFWRRSLWEKAGGKLNTEFSYAADFDLWTRFYKHANLYGVAAPVGGFRVRKGQRLGHGNRYASEANASLARARSESQWSPSVARRWSRILRLNEMPKLKVPLRNSLGYDAASVERTAADSPEARWTVRNYKFF